jgi:hypothetical protein
LNLFSSIRAAAWAAFLVLASTSSCGRKPASRPADFSHADFASVTLASSTVENGLRFLESSKKEQSTAAKMGGLQCRRFKRTGINDCYAYFMIDPSFKGTGITNARVEVDYFDSSLGSFNIEYDGWDYEAPDRSEKGSLRLVVYDQGAYVPSEEKITAQGTGQWETAEFHLKNVRFANSQNANADFRLRISCPEFFLRRVALHPE